MLKNLSVKTDPIPVFSYCACLITILILQFTGIHGEPYALAALFAALASGLSPILLCIAYAATNLIHGSLNLFLVGLGQSALYCIIFLIYRKTEREMKWESVFYIIAALAIYVAFGAFEPYEVLAFGFLNAVGQKVLISVVILLLSYVFFFTMTNLLKKAFRCRLRAEDLILLTVCAVLVGTGLFRALGDTIYTAFVLLLILFVVSAMKNSSVFAVALIASLPACFVSRSFLPSTLYLVYACAALALSRAPRPVELACVFAVFALAQTANGLYAEGYVTITLTLLSGAIPCLLFLFVPDFLLKKVEEKLIFYRERQLSRIAINRNRAITGERLFEISGVFREIEGAFTCINDSGSEKRAREFILGDLISAICKNCPNRPDCHFENLEAPLEKLIAVGCLKGKLNFIDLPQDITANCSNPGGILFALNKHLAEYKTYMLEVENANAGRALLAEQAKGVSEILKEMAMEQSEPLEIHSPIEREISLQLAKEGVLCTEILVYGENENATVSLITFGDADGRRIARIVGKAMAAPCMLSEKIPLDGERYCCIFRKKPKLDAAFGIASATKEKERLSGDTYSLIKIDERTFMVALSDGMGSGEYARKLSDSTISLIESFYRTKMPSGTVLETVNKLLTYNREDGFVCLDIAAVDLETGVAEIIKIGSPTGFILSGKRIRLLTGESLPLGALESMRPITGKESLENGDMLLFLSDGITAAFGTDAELLAYLKLLRPLNPQSLAETLLDEAKRLYGGVAKDDMTALAVRIFAA